LRRSPRGWLPDRPDRAVRSWGSLGASYANHMQTNGTTQNATAWRRASGLDRTYLAACAARTVTTNWTRPSVHLDRWFRGELKCRWTRNPHRQPHQRPLYPSHHHHRRA
jgi:hypothetical protein